MRLPFAEYVEKYAKPDEVATKGKGNGDESGSEDSWSEPDDTSAMSEENEASNADL